MPFNTIPFWAFFAVIALLFGIVPQRYRWVLFLTGSLFFFAWALPIGLVYLLSVVLITWICSIQIEKLSIAEETAEDVGVYASKKRMLLAAELCASLGVLLVLKYFNFFAGLVPGADKVFSLPVRFAVPLGLSFYTFQLTGYAIDVYRGVVPAQKNLAKLLLFTSYFPQLIEGPISRYEDIHERLYNPGDITYTRGRDALLLFAWGLFKKICIADNLSVYTDHLFESYQSYSGLMILSAGIVYAIYLYADFSGCIDMARAVSAYLGVPLKQNFMRPFFARTIKEYWRRWHITLSQWFRDYLFYPLLRSKWLQRLTMTLKKRSLKRLSKTFPTSIALLVVWTATGLWHGANGTFIVHGLYHGMLMIGSLVFQTIRSKKKNVKHLSIQKYLEIIRTFLLVSFSFLIFRAPSLSVAWEMIKRLFDFRHLFVLKQAALAYRTFLSGIGGMPYLIITAAGILLVFYNDVMTERNKPAFRFISRAPKIVKYLLSMLVVLLLLFLINRSAGDFTYMQF